MKMKKFLLLSASMLALSGITPVVSINAQNNDVGTVAISQEQTSELQNAFDEAVSLYQSYYPNAELTDIDIHMHQETGQFITRVLGRGETEAYQLIRYNGENFFASKSRDDDDDNLAINVDELASIEEITQSVMDHTQNNNIVNWSLDSDDDDDISDDDKLEWEITLIDGNREIEVEIDALTGDILDQDDDDRNDINDDVNDDDNDDDDDRHYYRQFYNDYSGSRPTVYDNNYYYGRDDDRYDDDDRDDDDRYDDDWDDDDWDDDDRYDDDWDDDDWDDDDWDDDDWDDDDWDDDDWDDDDWDDDDWDDDDWDDDDWDDDDWDDDDWDDDDWDDDDWDDDD